VTKVRIRSRERRCLGCSPWLDRIRLGDQPYRDGRTSTYVQDGWPQPGGVVGAYAILSGLWRPGHAAYHRGRHGSKVTCSRREKDPGESNPIGAKGCCLIKGMSIGLRHMSSALLHDCVEDNRASRGSGAQLGLNGWLPRNPEICVVYLGSVSCHSCVRNV